ncbi:MAG: diguanylate cyclase [Spirochaetales bacterium]|nr:diguanylate cyclase [Spirochaetales bacterium]
MKDEKTWKTIILALIVFVLVMTMAMIVYISVRQHGLKTDSASADSVYMVEEGWAISGPYGYSEFTDFEKELSVNELHLSRIFIFPQSYREDTLSFVANFCSVQVIQDGNIIYSFGSPEMIDGGIFPGKYEVNVKLNVYPGEASEVEVVFYSSAPLTISPFYFGDSLDLMHDEIRHMLPTVLLVTGTFVLFFAMIIILILGRKKYTPTQSFIYFLWLIAAITSWILSNIKSLGHLGINMGVASMAAAEFFMIIPIFFSLFQYHSFSRLRGVNLVTFLLSVLNFIVVNILHLTRTLLVSQTTVSGEILVGLCFAIAVTQAIIEYVKVRSRFSIVLLLEFAILAFGAFGQMYVHDTTKSPYFSQILIIPMTLFLFLHMGYVVSEFFSLMAEGRKAGDYLNMAKTDPLTGLGNRRALDQYIAQISNTTAPFFRIGCIVCDLNDLKVTNDLYGHLVGDQLIKDFAKCLEICFENRGVPFRTGGDEFYILFSDVEVDMSAMMRRLMIGIEGSNTSTEYKLSCSSGCYADYVPSHNETAVWDIIKFADAEMYKQKKKDREARRVAEGGG